jgi:hypothetical protein
MRTSLLIGLLVTLVSLAWTGGATARVGQHAAVADCCYEIAYDQYEHVAVHYTANGSYAAKQGGYFAMMRAHLRMLASAVTDGHFVHFLPVTEERTAVLDETDGFQTRRPAPNRSAQPGPWQDAPDCHPSQTGPSLLDPADGDPDTGTYAPVSGRNRDLVRIDRSRKRTEVVFGQPIRDWRFECSEYYRPQQGGSGEGTYPLPSFTNLTPIAQSPRALPLVKANGKAAVCHLAGYQSVDLRGGDLSYQFKGTYSASVRIKKVPSGARKAELRKLGKLEGLAPLWLPGIYAGFFPIGDIGPLSPDVPRTGCS